MSSSVSSFVPLLVSFGGEMGHGKDTFATFIAEVAAEEGIVYDFSKFAAELRKVMTIITGIPAEQTTSNEDKARMLPNRCYTVFELKNLIAQAIEYVTEKEAQQITVNCVLDVLTGFILISNDYHYPAPFQLLRVTIGRFLQILGTDAFRVYVEEDVWVNSFHRCWIRNGKKPTLVPDNRFVNETESIQKAGGVAVYIERRDYEGRDDGRVTAHPSENKSAEFIAGFDFHILNDGSIEDLRLKARELWPKIKELALERSGVCSDTISDDTVHLRM